MQLRKYLCTTSHDDVPFEIVVVGRGCMKLNLCENFIDRAVKTWKENQNIHENRKSSQIQVEYYK